MRTKVNHCDVYERTSLNVFRLVTKSDPVSTSAGTGGGLSKLARDRAEIDDDDEFERERQRRRKEREERRRKEREELE